MNRRNFVKSSTIISIALIGGIKSKADALGQTVNTRFEEYRQKIISLITGLKSEGCNLVKKIMNGKKYVFDPFTHYPYDGGIKDKTTGCQLFFHAHRENEYGHFHTFATDENGDLVHLLLISMNLQGEPIGLATVNRWVAGDKYVNADALKKFAGSFYVDPTLFEEKRVVEFVNYIFKAFPEEINNLFDERDKWISEYAGKNYREPFEDREFEVISYREIILR